MTQNFGKSAKLLVAALILPASALTATSAPAQATPIEAAAARTIAESLVEAVNGRRADRRNWGYDHIASERLREAEVDKLDTLSRRGGGLSLDDVQTAQDGSIVMSVTPRRGRSGTIRLTMDSRRPDKVVTITTSGL